MTFDEFWKHYVGGDKDKSLETGRIYAASAWDYQQARIEALEKDFAYHSELCTIQQARIDELEGALTAAYQEGWEAGKDTCVVDGDFSHDFKDSSTKALLGGEG